MKQNIFQKLGNQVSKLMYKPPVTDLEKNRSKNIGVKEALERISKRNQSEKFAEIDMRRLIDRYGHESVANVLSNSANFRKKDEVEPNNLLWARQYPTSAVHTWGRSEEYLQKFPVDYSKDYSANCSGAFLNWAMEYTQKKEMKKNFLQVEDYEPLEEEELKGTVIALNPNAIRNPFAKEKAQLWVALEDTFQDNDKIMARNIASGVEMALDRSMILGEVKGDRIPKKAQEKVEKLFREPSPEEELYENGRPFLGKSSKNYKTLTMNDNVILVAEQKKDEIHFSTWKMENNEPSQKHDFGTDYDGAVRNFGVRSGIIQVNPVVNLNDFLKSKELAQEKAKETMATAVEKAVKEQGSNLVMMPDLTEEEVQQLIAEADKVAVIPPQHPNLTPEEMATFQQLLDKMNGPIEEEVEVEKELKSQTEEVENVKEWGEKRDKQIEKQEIERNYVENTSNLSYYENAKKISFQNNLNNRIVTQMDNIALIATLTQGTEVLFSVCHVDEEKQRITPMSQGTNHFAFAESMFAEEVTRATMDDVDNIENQDFEFYDMTPPPEFTDDYGYYEEEMAMVGER